MADKIGKLPALKNKNDAFREIIKITEDKRSHVMLDDAMEWMELKMRVIRILSKKGMKKRTP